MRHHLSITVNGQPRDEVALATNEPLPDVNRLAVVFKRLPESGGTLPLLRTEATASDFAGGAYRFERWHWWPNFAAGTYRARTVTVQYADGNSLEIPLNDEIVVDVAAPPPNDLPVFTAR